MIFATHRSMQESEVLLAVQTSVYKHVMLEWDVHTLGMLGVCGFERSRSDGIFELGVCAFINSSRRFDRKIAPFDFSV